MPETPPDPAPLRRRIEPHLPSLRRYARALTGTQADGDGLVRALLQALVDGQLALDPRDEARQGLFALFHRLHPRLPHPDRQALLLSVVEGFTIDAVTDIMCLTSAEVRRAIATARAAIAEMIRSRVLIIEDEPLIAMALEQLMTDMGHSIVGLATTEASAMAAVAANPPDIVLADIQLADGSSGIDAVNRILAVNMVPVIFITAYPERLLTGLLPEPAFLIAKPFDPDVVVATVGQALLARLPDFAPGA
ncbi:MAG: response regulator [Sphingomonadales bacterium]|jgi:CheY-like chemotaxis protein/DNA-directed RNA polymerase specialized sigma24 family protein